MEAGSALLVYLVSGNEARTKMRIPTRRAVLQKVMEIRGERIKS